MTRHAVGDCPISSATASLVQTCSVDEQIDRPWLNRLERTCGRGGTVSNAGTYLIVVHKIYVLAKFLFEYGGRKCARSQGLETQGLFEGTSSLSKV